MNLSLHIVKNFCRKTYKNGRNVVFAVVDLDKPKEYPANYVCLLPKRFSPNAKQQSKFFRLFGEKSKCKAKKLLTQAFKDENHCLVRKEIRERLSLLGPKPAIMSHCLGCGKPFKVDKRKFRKYRLCFECYRKSTARRY